MKQSRELDDIQERMRPGKITLNGFLGSDERKLVDILAEDEAELGRLGVTRESLAKRMTELREAGTPGLGTPCDIGTDLRVTVETERGKLPCPFGDAGMHRKSLVTVENLRTGESVSYTDLGVHMVGEHGFFQGRGSSLRHEPGVFVRVLQCGNTPEVT